MQAVAARRMSVCAVPACLGVYHLQQAWVDGLGEKAEIA
jgi:hypothetical protein